MWVFLRQGRDASGRAERCSASSTLPCHKRRTRGWHFDCFITGMSTKDASYKELLTEHRVALDLWSKAKMLYWPDRPELISAAIRLQEIEDALEEYRALKAA